MILPLIIHFNWPFARDAAAYVSGVQSLLAGNDPYESEIFRAGLFGSLLIFLIAIVSPAFLESVIFLSLNILGMVCFVRYFSNITYRKKDFYILILISWSSASREGLNTIQIAGIILGLISVVLSSLDKSPNDSRYSFNFYLGIFCAAILVDLKPHFVLPLLVIVCIKKKKFRFGSMVIAVLISGHSIIDLWAGKFLTLTWFQLMLSLANKPIDSERQDFTNLWSIAFAFFDLGNFAKVLPYIVIVILTLFTAFTSLISIEKSIFVGLTLPLLSTYTHYYDYLGLVIMCVVAVAKSNRTKDLIVITPLLLIAENWQNLQGIFLILMFFLYYFFFLSELKVLEHLTFLAKSFIMSIGFYISIHVGQDYLIEQKLNAMAVSATSTLLIAHFFYWRSKSYSDFSS
jgi:hypothetical protein